MRHLCMVGLWMALELSAAAQTKVDISDGGAVNIEVAGRRCLDGFQVILPAPDWRGGAMPANCSKQVLGPGHTRVVGQFIDGQPCADFTLDVRADAKGLELAWELVFTRDLDVETVRLNGYLSAELSAGKAAWFVRRPGSLRWALFPTKLDEPGGDMSDWGFDWFGWLLPSGAGVRFRPLYGLSDMYLQDARAWGGQHFQTCWKLAGKGTVRAGTVLSCAIRVEPLTGEDILAETRRLGLSLIALAASLTPTANGVEGQVEVRNVKPVPQPVEVSWRVQDDIGLVLARSSQGLEVPALGTSRVLVSAPATPSGDYRLHAEVRAGGAPQAETGNWRLVVGAAGPRSSMSLDGTWELAPAGPEEQAPSAQAQWKPVRVPSPIDGLQHNRYWYRRSFELPAQMVGKRLKLHFGAVNHAAQVWVNGQAAGQHFGGDLPFEIDITQVARPGSNELLVAVTNWTAACSKPPESFEVKPLEHPGWKLPPASITAPIGGNFLLTGIWQSVSLWALPPVHLEDVFVQTSLRRRMIQVTATVRNEDVSQRTIRVANVVVGPESVRREGVVLRLPVASVTLAPGEEREVTVKAAWEKPHVWSLDDPRLYRLATTVTDGETTLDVLATRFGFREVWTDGPRFVLNGVPMKLFATSAYSMTTWEAAREYLSRMKRAGIRCVRLHTQPFQPHILDAADEVGMLIVDEAGVYCYAGAFAVNEERFWDNYATHVRGMARRDRNHPSLAIYSLENEILSCGGPAEVWEPRLGKLADKLREVDPTRLITCESDLDPAGKMDIIGIHYPREYWQGHTLYPGKCWWLDDEVIYLGRKWKWLRDKPLYIGEFDGGFPAWYPQYQAFWLGDEAYTHKGRFSAASPNSRARREMVAMEVAAYRYYGVTGLNPWFDADEVEIFGPHAYAPLALEIVEENRTFYAGQRIRRTVCVFNDSTAAARLTVAWCLSGRNVAAQSGQSVVYLPPCAATKQTITLRIGQVTTRQKLNLVVNLRLDGKVVASAEQVLSVFPQPSATQAMPNLGLYDPLGTTAAALRHVGLVGWQVCSPSDMPAHATTLLIGAGALASGEAPWAKTVAEFVRNGGTVLCMEQNSYPSRWLPVDVELDPDHAATIAFPRALGHPALADLEPNDLRFWGEDGLVSRRSLLKPFRGNFLPVVDAGGIKGAIHDLNGLNWAPVIELPYGRGRYVLCQLLVVEKAGKEPVAGLLLRNLVRYATSAPPNELARVAVLADSGSSLKRVLDGLSLVYDSLPQALERETLRRYKIIIAGGPRAGQILRENVSLFRAWIRAGGTLWLNCLTPDQTDMITELLGAPVDMCAAPIVPLCLAAPDSLTRGLSNHELYWRERPIWDQWTAMRPIISFEPRGLPPGAVMLTDPPGLVKVCLGSGCVIINQLLWDSTEYNRREGLRIASILLTNLGAELDTGIFKAADAGRFTPVDLRAYCNLGFEGDPGSGWMGHAPDALAAFPRGDQDFAGVRFRIIGGQDNGGRSLIALRGTERPAYPLEVKGIHMGLRARALHFLHTCAWGRPDGALAATYVLHYEDGTLERIPLRVNVEIADWYADPVALPYAQVAWQGQIADKPGPIGVHVLRWVNPYPDKTIATLDFVSANGDPVPVLIALTAER